MFLRDEGSVFDAPRDAVWEFVGSGDRHSSAHGHQRTRRQLHHELSGTYSWEQPFRDGTVRFTMRWTSFYPLGIAYEVLEGPFAGSRFFLIYEPRGSSTAVSVVGEFTSPTIRDEDLEPAVGSFFALEFEQDRAAIESARER